MSSREILFYLPQASVLLLFLLPLMYGQWALQRYRQHQIQAYASESLISHLLVPRSSQLTYTKIGGWICIWGLICLAGMEPFGNIRYSSLTHSDSNPQAHAQVIPHEVIFLVDTSASMGVPDSPEGETRLEESKVIMEDIIRQIRGQTLSLYAFTSELSAVVPPTVDYLFIRLSIKELHIDEGDVGGTRLAPVLTALQQQVFPQPSSKRYTLILLTDGGDTQLEILTGAAREKEIQSILTAIPHPQETHLRLFTIGLGSSKPHVIPHVTNQGKPVLSKLESDILKQLAEKERGKYYKAQDWTSWNLAQEIVSQMDEDFVNEPQDFKKEKQVKAINPEEVSVDLYYQFPLGLALLFYFINLLLPDVRRL